MCQTIGIRVPMYISWQKMLDVIYITDERNNNIYAMEESAGEIISMIIKNISVIEMINILSDKYSEDKEIIKEDIRCFIGELVEKEIIKVENKDE